MSPHTDRDGAPPRRATLSQRTDRDGAPPRRATLSQRTDRDGAPPRRATLSQRTDRYGAPPRWATLLPRRWAVSLAAIVVLGAGVAVAYAGYRNLGPQEVDTEMVNSRIVGNSAMAVTFTVTRKHPAEQVYCLIRVRDHNGGVVGLGEIPIPASDRATVTIDETIPTSGPPAVDEIVGCGKTIPNDLKSG